jgi:hypothetical protein
MNTSPLTQHEMFRNAHERLANRYRTFEEIQNGPNPLTPEEIEELIRRHPDRYAGFAPAGTGQACGAANECHLFKGHKGKHGSRFGRVW